MARRRKESGLDVIALMPWPVGIVLGLLAFWAIRYGLGIYFSSRGGPLLKPLGQSLTNGAFNQFAWFALALCWVGAAASFFKSRHRRALLDTQTGLDSIAAMSWRQFELLVGEAFRRRGYQVEETGLGGADGGIELILRKTTKGACPVQAVADASGQSAGRSRNVGLGFVPSRRWGEDHLCRRVHARCV